MGASRLSIYNGALRWLEERKLASLTENREPLRYMNDEFDENNLFCLAEGNWNFAMREIQMGPEETTLPNFGLNFCFRKPFDWNHTYQVAASESFDPLIRDLKDQHGFWFSNSPILYVRYVSMDPNYGLNMGLWPPAFIQYVEARLAWLCAGRLKQKQGLIDGLKKLVKSTRAEAISTDSQDLPPGKTPAGTWVLARMPRISYELDDGDLPLPGGAQNTQPVPPVIPVIVTDTGAAIETDNGAFIIVEP